MQEAEIARHQNELIATVLKQAEIEKQRVLNIAEGEKQRLIAEAEGRANAIRMQGEAEADIIFKKGEAEAKAMNIKAEAYQEYNQAAVVDKLITGLPEIVRAMASPLANVDKITIVSTGNGITAGMSKITGDMAEIAAQVPALFEALSGMSMAELFSKVKQIGDKGPKPSPELPGGRRSCQRQSESCGEGITARRVAAQYRAGKLVAQPACRPHKDKCSSDGERQ